MFLSLEDFDVDLFLRLDDENIFIYYIDFETIPALKDLIPLGSFDEDGKFKFTNLDTTARKEVGSQFMIRDGFIKVDPISGDRVLVLQKFIEEFNNIPEVMKLIKKYTELCNQTPTPTWCKSCNGDCPDYCIGKPYCAIEIPVNAISEEDFYFAIIIYFNGIYRTNPLEAQDFTPYRVLTDINFDLNRYSLIINIEEFFTKEFQWYLSTLPGAIPFASGYGCTIKEAVQTKNDGVRQRLVEDEINYFIVQFNAIYKDLVEVQRVSIEALSSNTGGDSWRVNVFANIKKERLVYRVEF